MKYWTLFLWLGATSALNAQALEAIPAQISFANTNELQTSQQSLTLHNPNTDTLHVRGVQRFYLYETRPFTVSDSVFTVAPGDSFTVSVGFQPSHNIQHQQGIIFLGEGGYGHCAVELSGQGVYSNGYYSTTRNLDEEALKTALSARLAQGFIQRSYTAARDEMYANLDNHQGDVECIYTGRKATFNTRAGANANNFNAEHIFPQGFFNSGQPMRADLHSLYPCDAPTNSLRNNHPFGLVPNPTSTTLGGSKYANNTFEPRDTSKGVAARAMFYFVTRYQDYTNFFAPQESLLRQWHRNYSPTVREQNRSSDLQSFQGNRNPFVDYPQLERRISNFVSHSTTAPLYDAFYSDDTIGLAQDTGQRQYHLLIYNRGNQPLSYDQFTLSDPSLSLAAGQPGSFTLQPGQFQEVVLQFDASVNYVAQLDFRETGSGVQQKNIPIRSGSQSSTPALPEVQNVQLNASATQINLSWNLPGQPVDEVLVVAGAAPVSAQPSGNGSVYSANAQWGRGTAIAGGEYVVYQGTGTQVLMTGLSSQTTYYLRLFTRRGTQWSSGLPVQTNTGSLASGWSITALDQVFQIDFDQHVPGVQNGSWSGAGLLPSPGNGQLSSQSWAVRGMSDGDVNFGESGTSGDFARGTSSGGDNPGGLYAFEVSNGNYALGLQPTGGDFTPGSLVLRMINKTGHAIDSLTLAYTVYEYNDQPRSNDWTFDYSSDDINYQDVTALVLESTAAGSSTPQWRAHRRIVSLHNLNWNPGAPLYLRWRGDDQSGGGSRDEFALDDIAVIAHPGSPFTVSGAHQSLSIAAGTFVNVPADTHYLVHEALRNEGHLFLASGAALRQSSAQDANSGAGTFRVARQVEAPEQGRTKLWAAPLQVATFENVFGNNSAAPTREDDWYRWLESSQQWSSRGAVSQSDTFLTARGYRLPVGGQSGSALPVNETRYFSGERLHNAGQSLSLPAGPEELLLLGNPYPSVLDAQAFTDGNTNPDLDGTLYFWDDSGLRGNADFTLWNQSGAIRAHDGASLPDGKVGSCQGFFARSLSAQPQVHFSNAMRISGDNSHFWKQSRAAPERFWLNVSKDTTGFSEMLISLDNAATPAFDRGLDGRAIPGYGEVDLYSWLNGKAYSIQALPQIPPTAETVVALGLDVREAGNYTFSLDSLDNWPAGQGIFLEDSLKGQVVDLRQGDYSTHIGQPGSFPHRFYLRLGQVSIGVAELKGTSDLNYYQRGEELIVSAEKEIHQYRRMRVLSLSAQPLFDNSLSDGRWPVALPLHHLGRGVYLLEVTHRKGQREYYKFYWR